MAGSGGARRGNAARVELCGPGARGLSRPVTRHLGRTEGVLSAVQAASKSRVNVNHIVIPVARPRELPLRRQGRRVPMQGVPVRGFFE